MVERLLFEWVLDAFEGFAHEVDGTLESTSHRRGLKVWYGDAKKEHYEAQLIRTADRAALEIGFHAEYPKVEDNDEVLDRLVAHERTWRRILGDEPEVGEFIGAERWRRISEVWEAPDPDDPEASIEIAARLADYVIALEPIRRAGPAGRSVRPARASPRKTRRMETTTVARSMRGSIGMLAMEWLMADSTRLKAAERGMTEGMGAYAVGRLGVLGDCPVDNVVAAAFFWEPDLMRSMVAEGRAVTPPAEGAEVYAQICREWGLDHLTGFDGSERMGELCAIVVAAANPLGAPTFVGWRDMPLPASGPDRTFQLCQIVRELRFGRHCVAVQASGMSPLEAILSGPAGEWNAEMFGWPRPYPEVSGLAERRDEIEAATDRLHAPDFEVLTPDERAELRDLAKAARVHASGERSPR